MFGTIHREFKKLTSFFPLLVPTSLLPSKKGGSLISQMAEQLKKSIFFSPSFWREAEDSVKSNLRKGRDGYKARKEGKILIFETLSLTRSQTCICLAICTFVEKAICIFGSRYAPATFLRREFKKLTSLCVPIYRGLNRSSDSF